MHRFGSGNGGDGLIQAKTGSRNNDLLSGIQNAEKGREQCLAGPHGNQHLVRRGHMSPGCLKSRHRFPQFLGALVGGIVGLIGM